jgi:hypothetical protein
MAESGSIGQKHTRAIRALLVCPGVPEAAELTGLGERTIYRWLKNPDFRRQLADAERAILEDAQRRLLQLQTPAIDALAALLDPDADTAAGVQLRAVELTLSHVLKLREAIEIETRLEALETAVLTKAASVAGVWP